MKKRVGMIVEDLSQINSLGLDVIRLDTERNIEQILFKRGMNIALTPSFISSLSPALPPQTP